jgi:hypothetical protein
MSEMTKFGKVLRWVGVILLGFTGFFHLMGGAGTSCVALAAEKYDSMTGIIPYKWAYQLFVVVTLAIAVYTIRATIRFARGKPKSYLQAVVILIIGAVVTAIHVFTSRALRGSSMPNDARLYMDLLTLVVFLLFSIPGIRNQMNLNGGNGQEDGGASIGSAFILMGAIALTIHIWMGPTHTWSGVNYADVWHTELTFVGVGLLLAGIPLLLNAVFARHRKAEESIHLPC